MYSEILALVECENIREQARKSAMEWASNCSTGYLEYLVAEIVDPQVRAAELRAANARTPVGSTVSRV